MSGTEPVPRIGRGRCGCASTDCTCTVFGAGTITVIGTGSESSPYKFIADAQIIMEVLDTPEVDLTLTGSGTPADPYILSGEVDITTSQSYLYFTPGTYTLNIEPGQAFAATVLGAGGGGGGGQVGADGLGGAGGTGGAATQVMADLPPSASPYELEITIGTGGTGHAANTSGKAGDGGFSRIRRRQGAGPWTVVALSSGGGGGYGGISGGVSTVGVGIGAVLGGRGDYSIPAGPSNDTAWAPTGGGAGRSLGANAKAPTPGGGIFVRDTPGGDAGTAVLPGMGGNLSTGGGGGYTGAGGFGGPGGGGGGGGAAGTVTAGSGAAGGDGLIFLVVW